MKINYFSIVWSSGMSREKFFSLAKFAISRKGKIVRCVFFLGLITALFSEFAISMAQLPTYQI